MTNSECLTDTGMKHDERSFSDEEIEYDDQTAGSKIQNSNTTHSNCQEDVEMDICAAETCPKYETKEILPPDGGWGWFCVLGATLTHCLIGGVQRTSGLIFIQLRHMFQGSASATAWVLILGTVLQLLLGPLSSSLCNKFSCRSVAMVGGFLTALGFGLSYFATALWHLFLTLGIIRGFGLSFAYTPCLVAVNQYFNKRRGIAVGLSVSGVGLGTFALPPFVELMFETFGFYGTILLLSGISLNLCVCGALYRPLKANRSITTEVAEEKELLQVKCTEIPSEKRNHETEICDSGLDNKIKKSLLDVNEQPLKADKKVFIMKWLKEIVQKKKSDGKKTKKILDLSLLKNLHYLSFCVVNGLFTLTIMSYNMFTSELATSRGLTELEAAYILSMFGVADSISRILSSVILDLKSVKYYRLLVYSFSLLFVSIGYLALPFLYGFYMYAVVCSSLGVVTGLYIAQKSVVLIDVLGPDKLSSSFGLLICFQGVGTLIGPTFSGFLRDISNSYNQTYYFLASVVFCGFSILMTSNLIFKYCRRRTEKCRIHCCLSQ